MLKAINHRGIVGNVFNIPKLVLDQFQKGNVWYFQTVVGIKF